MRSIFLTLSVLVFTMISCKNDNSSDSQKETAVVNKPFTVTVNLVAEQDDTFQVYFNEDGKEAYEPANAVTISFTGSKNAQDVLFPFSNEVSPMALRLDIGANQELKKVKINSIKIEFRDKIIDIKGADLSKFFVANPQVKFDSSTSTANIEVEDGVFYDPFFLPSPELLKQIETLYAKKAE